MNYKYIKTLLLTAICAGMLTTSATCFSKAIAGNQPTQAVTQQANTVKNTVNPLSIVENPRAYLNKNVTMNAKFDKFSTLGLDYKPAFKSSEEYISFLIKRNDTSFNIPLSEMKLFLKRSKAEKFLDLKTNDEIQITGIVFSDALGDAWVDVCELTVTKKAEKENNQ